MKIASRTSLSLLLLLAFSAAAPPQSTFDPHARAHPVYGRNGMVASQDATATRVGIEVLKRGGNAVDAAVTVAFAMAVTLPRAGNIGGGGFMLIHDAATKKTVAIDYREKAPEAATIDLFLDDEGNAIPERSRFSHLAAGVPGTVAGMAMALERFGSISLAEALEPAIHLARDGVTVSNDLSASLKDAAGRLRKWPATETIFFKPDGAFYEPGDRLIQGDLANSLATIASDGPAALYGGVVGAGIVAEMERGNGILALSDLRSYHATPREPIRGTYRGHEIISMPPPSSGGVHLIQILNILEGYPLSDLGHNSADTIHRMAEAMKFAYADRAEYLGDPDFVDVPVAALTSKDYAANLRARIDPLNTRPSPETQSGDLTPYESPETTHFSVVDAMGNIVSNTYTLNYTYGSGIVAEGTGILLNNELDDFSAKPGAVNLYGLTGGRANAVAGGKRPLSSMTPAIVFRDRKPILVTGSPGGSRIITTTLQILLNTIDHGLNLAEATNAPRVHHQWLPDELRIEQGLSPDTIRRLQEMGHQVVVKSAMGSTHSIQIGSDGLYGSSDPRRPGALALGY